VLDNAQDMALSIAPDRPQGAVWENGPLEITGGLKTVAERCDEIYDNRVVPAVPLVGIR